MCAMTGLNILPSLLWESVSEGQESGLLQRKMSLFNDSKESRYDIESSCKTQVAGAAAKLPKRTYSLINLFSYSLHKKAAFTLAEVLITLGIIGVVAAMTMPVLIQNHRNTVVETRLKKFYSAINQAVTMAENDYGEKNYWYADLQGAQTDDEGNLIPDSSESLKWFNKYLAPYMAIIKTEELSDGTFIVYFPDGSALKQYQQATTRDWFFYPSKAKDCIGQYGDRGGSGICAFAFIFNLNVQDNNPDNIYWRYHYNKGFEPWMYNWDGTRESLLNGCKTEVDPSLDRNFCTALIRYDGWKITKDYPHRVK